MGTINYLCTMVPALPHNSFFGEFRLLSEVVTVASKRRKVCSLQLETLICSVLIAVAVVATLGWPSNDLGQQVPD
jgi:hypothetical protein